MICMHDEWKQFVSIIPPVIHEHGQHHQTCGLNRSTISSLYHHTESGDGASSTIFPGIGPVPNNRSQAVLESGQLVAPQYHMPLVRGAVSASSIASLELQGFVEPLPLDQLICHTPVIVQAWPTVAREEVHAVAHRDLASPIADFTRYLDLHAAHLAACAGALDDTVPLMAAETFPRLPGGTQSALRDMPVADPGGGGGLGGQCCC